MLLLVGPIVTKSWRYASQTTVCGLDIFIEHELVLQPPEIILVAEYMRVPLLSIPFYGRRLIRRSRKDPRSDAPLICIISHL